MIEFNGFEEVFKHLEKLGDTSNLEAALGKACALVEGVAREKAPKGKTGDLRKFMSSEVEHNGEDLIGIVFNPLEYAPYVEFGTGLYAEKGGRKDVPWAYEDEKTGELIWTAGQKPQPFLRPALNENREEIKRILMEGLTNDR